MSLAGRIGNLILAAVQIALSIILVLFPQNGYFIVAGILGISLAAYGIRNVVYYVSMARHMVGGRMILYFGLLVFDAGALILALSDVPPLYVMIYLIVIRALTGTIDILRAMEQKKMGSRSWKFMFISGLIHILIAVVCAIFIKSTEIAVYIYAAGLVYSAITRIINAVRTPDPITIL